MPSRARRVSLPLYVPRGCLACRGVAGDDGLWTTSGSLSLSQMYTTATLMSRFLGWA